MFDKVHGSLKCFLTATVLAVAIGPASTFAQVAPTDPGRFSDAIADFEERDARAMPAPGGVVIVGSSSVRMLSEETLFPGLSLINRGFGGAHISDINHYIEQTVLKYRPQTVVFFCGNNDLWHGRSVDEVVSEFEKFRETVYQRLPDARLIVLALRPSPARITIIEKELATNKRLQQIAADDPRMTFLRGSCDRFIDSKKKPIESLYASDRLHMNDAGYQIWQEILSPELQPFTASEK